MDIKMNEKIYKAMVDHSPLGLAYYQKIYGANGFSKDYKLIDVNPAFEEMIGMKSKMLIGRKVSAIFEAMTKDKLNWMDFYQNIKSDHQNQEYDLYLDCLDKYYRIKTHFLEDDYLIVYFNDVSLEMSDVVDKAKSQFLSNISHEIRTPMNAVIGYSNSLAATDLTSKQEKYINGVRASAEILMSIINDILDWSKIESDGLELEVTIFDLDTIVNNVVEQIKFKSDNDKVKILFEKKEDIPAILCGDSLRLQQVLLNLLSNAVRFTEMGQIKMSIQLLKNDKDKVTLQFEISDTGIGIDKEEIKDIFSPFKQVNNKLSGKFAGTGLGLSICKRIILLMGGDIMVRSNINQGSTFTFTANFQPVDFKKMLELRKNGDLFTKERIDFFKKLSGAEVLVVDDNEINQDVIKEILEELGIIVSLSSSGLEAVENVKVKEFDIVLMDLRMPLMDGYEASKKIREIKKPQDLPIIAVTASASPEEREKCKGANIDDFIVKPIEKVKLFNAMIRFVDKSLERDLEFNSILRDKKDVDLSKKDKEIVFLELQGLDVGEALNHLNGNHKLLSKILKKFKKNHGNVVNEIRMALASGNIDLATRLAHTIKGVAGEISAKAVNEAAADVEYQLIVGNLDIEKILAVLEKDLQFIFDSQFFILKKVEENNMEKTKEIDQTTLKPLLAKLERLLSEYDMDASEQIDKIEEISKGSFINTKVLEMKEYGEEYDFENALKVLGQINKKLDGEGSQNGK